MKILHTGDVHLDSPFAGLDTSAARQRRSELRETFASMTTYAREGGVDLMLIAGDLFDKNYVTRDTIALLRREFAKLDCPVVIAPGNHDPAEEKSIWEKNIFSDNVFVFSSADLSYFSFPQLRCRVYGYAFPGPSLRTCPLEGRRIEDASWINILCAHGDATSPISTYGPLPAGVLEAFGADYCALGHFHNPENATAALTVLGAYCGCPEGRDFGETGSKGAILVSLEKDEKGARLSWERLRFCRKIYETRTLNIDGAAQQEEVAAAVHTLIQKENFDKDTLLRITLQGNIESNLSIDTTALEAAGAELAHLEVRDATVPTWNAAALLQDQGMRGELYRVLLPKLESADPAERETGSRALRYAMAALAGEELPAD